MEKSKLILLPLIAVILFLSGCTKQSVPALDTAAERREIARVIDSCIGWFKTKDFDLYFSSVAQDSNFIAVHPGNNVVRGFAQVIENSEIFKRTEFQYVRHEIRDQKITLSRNGDTAWFFCMLNDINTWDGRPANWENTRWTGVLEKRDGRWVIVQQHFSFASE